MRSIGLLVLAGMLAVACGDDGSDSGDGGAAEPAGGESVETGAGIEGDTLKVASLMPSPSSAGPAAQTITWWRQGTEAYYRHINEAGGIGGRFQIEWELVDNQMSPEVSLQKFQQIKDDVVMLDFAVTSTSVSALIPRLDQMVLTPGTLSSEFMFEPAIAPWGSPYPVEFSNGLSWYIENRAEAPADELKVGMFGIDDVSGHDALRGVEAAQEELGFEIVSTSLFALNTADFSGAVAAMKREGADVVVFQGISFQLATIINQMQALDYAPDIITTSGFDQSLVGTAEEPAPTADFVEQHLYVVAAYGGLGVTDTNEAAEILEKFGDGAPINITTMQAMSAAATTVALLERAFDNGDLTPAGVHRALTDSEEEFTLGIGEIVHEWTFGPRTERAVPRGSNVYAVDRSGVGGLERLAESYVSAAAEGLSFS